MPALIDLQRQSIAAASAAMNAHDAKQYAELFAPDATVHEYGLGQAKGREAIAAGVQGAFNGFPDLKVGVSKIFVKHDVVVQEWVITGTHHGEFSGAKPTGKTIGVHVASVLTFTPEGLIGSEHRYWDTSTVLSQLGLLDTPAGPVAALPTGDPEWHIAKGTPEEDALVEVAKAILGALSSGVLFAVDRVVVSEWSSARPTTMHVLDVMRLEGGKVLSLSSYANSFETLGQP